MADERKEPDEGFLGRWSRKKTEAREAPQLPPEQPPVAADAGDAPPPSVTPLDELTFDSDFKGFFHPKIDEGVRRAALRKLFSDPHFNVMDGLDVYIDDYSKSDPIPAAMLASLKQAQRIIDWANNKDEASEGLNGVEDTHNASPEARGLVVNENEVVPHAVESVPQADPPVHLDAPSHTCDKLEPDSGVDVARLNDDVR